MKLDTLRIFATPLMTFELGREFTKEDIVLVGIIVLVISGDNVGVFVFFNEKDRVGELVEVLDDLVLAVYVSQLVDVLDCLKEAVLVILALIDDESFIEVVAVFESLIVLVNIGESVVVDDTLDVEDIDEEPVEVFDIVELPVIVLVNGIDLVC
jgi:hypothetical protein